MSDIYPRTFDLRLTVTILELRWDESSS